MHANFTLSWTVPGSKYSRRGFSHQNHTLDPSWSLYWSDLNQICNDATKLGSDMYIQLITWSLDLYDPIQIRNNAHQCESSEKKQIDTDIDS